jgi:4-diphosphocytidyl-2-C-methyl-D-erythritol kinase
VPAVAETARIAAPAKVNLRLCILARETTGFHALETVFCALSLADEVEVRRADAGIHFRAEGGIEMGPPEQNLAVRAARRFHQELGAEPALRICLRKRIPSAAGLGGGSSDAAAVLRALNALEGEPLPPETLLQLGSELGSDVPFFLCGSALALAWGRGERLLALAPLPPRPVLVAHPGVAMPTGPAFGRIASARGADYRVPASALELASLQDWDAAAARAVNDFEFVADQEIPSLPRAREAMRAAGARVAMLSGSGASLFGVFHTEAERDRAAEAVGGLGFAVWLAETLQTPPAPQVDPVDAMG